MSLFDLLSEPHPWWVWAIVILLAVVRFVVWAEESNR